MSKLVGLGIFIFIIFLFSTTFLDAVAQEDQPEYYPELCNSITEFPVPAGSFLLEEPYHLFVDTQPPSGASFRVYDLAQQQTIGPTISLDQVNIVEYADREFICLSVLQWSEVLDTLAVENYRTEISSPATFEAADAFDLTVTAAVSANIIRINLEENALAVFFESESDYTAEISFPDGTLNMLEFNTNPSNPEEMFVFTGSKVNLVTLCRNEELHIYAFVISEAGSASSFCGDMVDGDGVRSEGYNSRVYVFPAP